MTTDQKINARGYSIRMNVNGGQIVSYSAMKGREVYATASSKTKLLKLVK